MLFNLFTGRFPPEELWWRARSDNKTVLNFWVLKEASALPSDSPAPVPRDQIRRHQPGHGQRGGAGGAGRRRHKQPRLWRRPMRRLQFGAVSVNPATTATGLLSAEPWDIGLPSQLHFYFRRIKQYFNKSYMFIFTGILRWFESLALCWTHVWLFCLSILYKLIMNCSISCIGRCVLLFWLNYYFKHTYFVSCRYFSWNFSVAADSLKLETTL